MGTYIDGGVRVLMGEWHLVAVWAMCYSLTLVLVWAEMLLLLFWFFIRFPICATGFYYNNIN